MSMGWCLDCGERTELVLPERFPHICHDCLFPPRKIGEDFRASAPEFLPVPTLIQKLHQMNKAVGAINPSQRRLDGGW